MLRRAGVFLAGSIAAQGVAALTGLFLARYLPIKGYAIYTVMTTIMGAVTLLTKGGVHLGYVALVARDWPDPAKLGSANKIAKAIRLQISAVILPPILLVTFFLLAQNGASFIEILLLISMLVVFWLADMQTRVVDAILSFAKETTRVQFLDTILSLLRFLCVLLTYYVGQLTSITAAFFGVLVSGLRVWPILFWTRRRISVQNVVVNADDLRFVRNTALRQIPIEFFTVFQAQIVILILSFYGQTGHVADYGALGRIAQLLLPVQAFSFSFCIPMFTRENSRIFKAFVHLSILCTVPAILLLFITLSFPNQVLYLIGPNYKGLTRELSVLTFNAGLYSSVNMSWSLLAHKGWNRWAWIQIPIGLLWCAFSPLVLDLHTLSGVLWLQLGFSVGLGVATVADLLSAWKRGLL